jgi:hypothetical protein
MRFRSRSGVWGSRQSRGKSVARARIAARCSALRTWRSCSRWRSREPHPVAIEPIGEHEGVPRERAHRRLGEGQLPRRRIGTEVQGAAEPLPEIVDGEEAARQHHRPFGPQELQVVGDGREARAIHDDHGREARLERREVGRVSGRGGWQEPGGEPGGDRGEEGRAERLAPLEESLGRRGDQREEGLRAFEGLVEGLAQRPGRPQDDGEPELDEGLQVPASLAFGGADGGEDRLAEGGGDVGAEKLQDADEIDRYRGRARSAHSPSFREKVYWPSV